jgi:hypothetical protein
MNELRSAASPAQWALLEDGALTFAEYESATFSTISCLEEGGIQVIHVEPAAVRSLESQQPGPRLTKRGRYEFIVKIPAGQDLQAQTRNETRCREEFSSLVDLLWAEHLTPTEEELQALRDAVADCLRQQGEQIRENPTDADLGVLGAEKVAPCLTRAKVELNWD